VSEEVILSLSLTLYFGLDGHFTKCAIPHSQVASLGASSGAIRFRSEKPINRLEISHKLMKRLTIQHTNYILSCSHIRGDNWSMKEIEAVSD
jgi:hypothetical protein